MIGLRRFLYPHHAMSGFAIVCGELTGMARMPMIDGRRSHLIISSCGSVLRFLLACGSSRLYRLISSASHLIGYRLAYLLPALRHGWAGREAGSVGALCLLGFCPAVCAVC